jgi:hypothetical protein
MRYANIDHVDGQENDDDDRHRPVEAPWEKARRPLPHVGHFESKASQSVAGATASVPDGGMCVLTRGWVIRGLMNLAPPTRR